MNLGALGERLLRELQLKLRGQLLNGEIFYSLKKVQVLAERWRAHYNTIIRHPAAIPVHQKLHYTNTATGTKDRDRQHKAISSKKVNRSYISSTSTQWRRNEGLGLIDPRLLAHGLQILRLCIWLVLLAAIFAPLERLFALHPKEIFRKAIVTDLGYYFLSSLVPSILLSVPLSLVAWSVHRFIPADFTATIAAWPIGARVIASLLVGEIGFYWGHRWSHEVPLLWRFHAIHHSAEHIDFLVNTRSHPVDMVFTRLCGLVPLYILGLASPMAGSASLIPVLIILVGTVWGFFIHANVRWRFGPIEWLVATPAFHHWHHTNDGPDVINKNYSPMLPFIDRIFGTLHLPKDKQPATYGINQPISPMLFGQLVDPFLFWRKDPIPSLTQDPSVAVIATQQASKTQITSNVGQ